MRSAMLSSEIDEAMMQMEEIGLVGRGEHVDCVPRAAMSALNGRIKGLTCRRDEETGRLALRVSMERRGARADAAEQEKPVTGTLGEGFLVFGDDRGLPSDFMRFRAETERDMNRGFREHALSIAHGPTILEPVYQKMVPMLKARMLGVRACMLLQLPRQYLPPGFVIFPNQKPTETTESLRTVMASFVRGAQHADADDFPLCFHVSASPSLLTETLAPRLGVLPDLRIGAQGLPSVLFVGLTLERVEHYLESHPDGQGRVWGALACFYASYAQVVHGLIMVRTGDTLLVGRSRFGHAATNETEMVAAVQHATRELVLNLKQRLEEAMGSSFPTRIVSTVQAVHAAYFLNCADRDELHKPPGRRANALPRSLPAVLVTKATLPNCGLLMVQTAEDISEDGFITSDVQTAPAGIGNGAWFDVFHHVASKQLSKNTAVQELVTAITTCPSAMAPGVESQLPILYDSAALGFRRFLAAHARVNVGPTYRRLAFVSMHRTSDDALRLWVEHLLPIKSSAATEAVATAVMLRVESDAHALAPALVPRPAWHEEQALRLVRADTRALFSDCVPGAAFFAPHSQANGELMLAGVPAPDCTRVVTGRLLLGELHRLSVLSAEMQRGASVVALVTVPHKLPSGELLELMARGAAAILTCFAVDATSHLADACRRYGTVLVTCIPKTAVRGSPSLESVQLQQGIVLKSVRFGSTVRVYAQTGCVYVLPGRGHERSAPPHASTSHSGDPIKSLQVTLPAELAPEAGLRGDLAYTAASEREDTATSGRIGLHVAVGDAVGAKLVGPDAAGVVMDAEKLLSGDSANMDYVRMLLVGTDSAALAAVQTRLTETMMRAARPLLREVHGRTVTLLLPELDQEVWRAAMSSAERASVRDMVSRVVDVPSTLAKGSMECRALSDAPMSSAQKTRVLAAVTMGVALAQRQLEDDFDRRGRVGTLPPRLRVAIPVPSSYEWLVQRRAVALMANSFVRERERVVPVGVVFDLHSFRNHINSFSAGEQPDFVWLRHSRPHGTWRGDGHVDEPLHSDAAFSFLVTGRNDVWGFNSATTPRVRPGTRPQLDSLRLTGEVLHRTMMAVSAKAWLRERRCEVVENVLATVLHTMQECVDMRTYHGVVENQLTEVVMSMPALAAVMNSGKMELDLNVMRWMPAIKTSTAASSVLRTAVHVAGMLLQLSNPGGGVHIANVPAKAAAHCVLAWALGWLMGFKSRARLPTNLTSAYGISEEDVAILTASQDSMADCAHTSTLGMTRHPVCVGLLTQSLFSEELAVVLTRSFQEAVCDVTAVTDTVAAMALMRAALARQVTTRAVQEARRQAEEVGSDAGGDDGEGEYKGEVASDGDSGIDTADDYVESGSEQQDDRTTVSSGSDQGSLPSDEEAWPYVAVEPSSSECSGSDSE